MILGEDRGNNSPALPQTPSQPPHLNPLFRDSLYTTYPPTAKPEEPLIILLNRYQKDRGYLTPSFICLNLPVGNCIFSNIG